MASVKYTEILKSIQNSIIALSANIDFDKPVVNVNWNTRSIELPREYQSFLAVQNDQYAETIQFGVDRYFDSVDLSKMVCIVEYVNASNQARVSPVVDIDLLTNPNKIYFKWKPGYGATKTSGNIQFVIRFYAIDPDTNEYIYNISTQPCTARILKNISGTSNGKDVFLTKEETEKILGKINSLEQKAVEWVDL